MNKTEIFEALKALGEELLKKSIQGEVLIFGGAAMCLAHDARDSTKDVDALFEPKSEISEAIIAVAEKLNLEEAWLNDSVKGFLFSQPERIPYIEFPGLQVTTVKPEYLLAMKLFSARTSLYETDRRDIAKLVDVLGIISIDQAFDILEKYFPRDKVLPKTQYLLEEVIQELQV